MLFMADGSNVVGNTPSIPKKIHLTLFWWNLIKWKIGLKNKTKSKWKINIGVIIKIERINKFVIEIKRKRVGPLLKNKRAQNKWNKLIWKVMQLRGTEEVIEVHNKVNNPS